MVVVIDNVCRSPPFIPFLIANRVEYSRNFSFIIHSCDYCLSKLEMYCILNKQKQWRASRRGFLTEVNFLWFKCRRVPIILQFICIFLFVIYWFLNVRHQYELYHKLTFSFSVDWHQSTYENIMKRKINWDSSMYIWKKD